MQRRTFLIFAGLASAVSMPAFSNNIGPNPEPFKTITPILPGELKKVHAVISFSCPICAKYHASLNRWGDSLPKEISFDFIPAVTDKDSAIMAALWSAMKRTSPQHLTALASVLYTSVQEKGITPTNSGRLLLDTIAKQIGPRPDFLSAVRSGQFADVEANQLKIANFKVDSTPSIIVGGRFLITPDHTDGNEELFMQLASAMVSKSL